MLAALLQEATMIPVQTATLVTDQVTIMIPTAMTIQTENLLGRVQVSTAAAHIPLLLPSLPPPAPPASPAQTAQPMSPIQMVLMNTARQVPTRMIDNFVDSNCCWQLVHVVSIIT